MYQVHRDVFERTVQYVNEPQGPNMCLFIFIPVII